MKKIFLLLFLSLLISIGFAASKPNIIVILADDMGYDSINALNPKNPIPSPHLDTLLKQGMNFTDAHSGSAVCTPTRYGLLTGRYCWRSRLQKSVLWTWDKPLIPRSRLTIATMLRRKGYKTACIGKWHLGWEWPKKNDKIDFTQAIKGGPTELGFDYYFGDDVPNFPPYVYIENQHTVGLPTAEKPKKMFGGKGPMLPGWKLENVMPDITAKSVEYINARGKDKKPFFLYFSLTAPHTPIAPSKEFQGKSGIGPYADFLMETDWSVGQIVSALKVNGLSDNTLLIFTADNGTSPHAKLFDKLKKNNVDLQYHFRGNKADAFEGGHRVPFIASWPGQILAGSKSGEVICLNDIMATAAELTDFDFAENEAEDSRSLLTILKGKKLSKPLHEYLVNHSINGKFAIRSGKWKLIFCAGSGGWSGPREKRALAKKLPTRQLYNLGIDLKEKNNLIAEYPELVEEMTNALIKIISDGRSTPGKTQKNDVAVAKNEFWMKK